MSCRPLAHGRVARCANTNIIVTLLFSSSRFIKNVLFFPKVRLTGGLHLERHVTRPGQGFHARIDCMRVANLSAHITQSFRCSSHPTTPVATLRQKSSEPYKLFKPCTLATTKGATKNVHVSLAALQLQQCNSVSSLTRHSLPLRFLHLQPSKLAIKLESIIQFLEMAEKLRARFLSPRDANSTPPFSRRRGGRGPDLLHGFAGTKLAKLSATPKKIYAVSCGGARAPGKVVALARESTVGFEEEVKKQNGAANGAVNGGVNGAGTGVGNGAAAKGVRGSSLEEARRVYDLEPPGPASVHNYMEQVPFFLTDDGGPPRWFSPVTPAPPLDAPTLLFLPGMDGTGLGLLLHYESLGRLFSMQCLHIPVRDRTPFTGLLKIAEEAVLAEHARRPNTPIYLIGDSFGGSLSLAVAARNPKLDLVLILANPATSFDRSQLKPLFPLLQGAPSELFAVVPYLVSFIMGDPIKMAEARVKVDASPAERALQIREALLSLLPTLPTLADVIPKDALLWKLELLHSAALFTNSRLHAVRAQVLILASGKDQLLPSAEESKRLRQILPNCRTRFFKDSGHTLLLEGGLNLANVIQGVGFYRRGRTQDVVTDFVVPTLDEFHAAFEKYAKLIWQAVSPVFFSTSATGEVQQGLQNIPNDRPVLFVGNHMYFGLDMTWIVYKVFEERGLIIRALGHPVLYETKWEEDLQEASMNDLYRAFGSVPVTGKNMFKLLKMGYSTLLYPGGAREALHRKGEAHKLFWPERSEFVRMAARFGCTIVPISTVGEDEIIDIIFDINDIRRIPTLEERVSLPVVNLRGDLKEEIADQPVHFPFAAPKLTPGRLYVKFGKPIFTAGREEELQKDKEQAQVIYKHVQGEVERGFEYLLWKREEDPYRAFGPRILYEQTAAGGVGKQAPTFKV